MPEHDHVALVIGNRPESELETPAAVPSGVVALARELGHLVARDGAALALIMNGDVPRNGGKNRRGERHRPRPVLADRGDQPHEHLMRGVLGLVGLTDDAEHIAVDVVLEANVQEPHGIHVAGLRSRFPRAKKAAALFRISRSIRSVWFSRRNRASSSLSSVLRPSGRLPSSRSACLTQLRRVTSEIPRSSAI